MLRPSTGRGSDRSLLPRRDSLSLTRALFQFPGPLLLTPLEEIEQLAPKLPSGVGFPRVRLSLEPFRLGFLVVSDDPASDHEIILQASAGPVELSVMVPGLPPGAS